MRLIDDLKAITMRAEIPAFLAAHEMNHRICEVGVRFGFHLRQLLLCNPEVCIGIDLWTDTGVKAQNDTAMNQRSLDRTYQNVFRAFLHDPRVKLFRGYSAGAAECIEDHSLDFCYIDADHTREGCWEDLCRWWKKVRRGGLLAGHDYIAADSANGVPFGVIEAVTQFREDKKIPPERFHFTEHGYRSWFLLNLEGE